MKFESFTYGKGMEHDACDAGNEDSNATNDVDATKGSRSPD